MTEKQELKFKKAFEGFTLIEVLVYMSFLAVIVAVIISSLMVVAEVQERVIAGKTLDRSANIALERFLREVRESESVNFDESVFNDPDGILVVNKTEGLGEVRFYIGTDDAFFLDKEGDSLRLTHKKVSVESFLLKEVNAGESEAVRVEMVLSHPYSDGLIEQAFYSTAILRGSYGE